MLLSSGHISDSRPPPRKRPPPPYLLLDNEKNIIYGRAQAINTLQLLTVAIDERIVGYVATSQLQDVSNSADKIFLEKQTRYFIDIALVACGLAIIFAFFIAGWMSSPIQRLVITMNRLMARDYTVKVHIPSFQYCSQNRTRT